MSLTTTRRTTYMCMSVRGGIRHLQGLRKSAKTYMTDDQGRALSRDEAINAMIRANDWNYGPSAPQTLDPVVVNAGPGFAGDGIDASGLGSSPPRFGSDISPAGNGGDEPPTSPLDRLGA